MSSKAYILHLLHTHRDEWDSLSDRVLFDRGVFADRKKALEAANAAQHELAVPVEEGTVEVLLIELELHE